MGTVVTPEWLARFSPDGRLSHGMIATITAGRVVAALVGGLIVAWALHWLWGWVPGILALAGAMACTTSLMQRLYPNHLLFRPQVLLQAVAGEQLLLSDYDPRTRLVVPAHDVQRAKFPAINIHAHFRRAGRHWTPEQMARIMDATNVIRLVDLDGGLGKSLQEEIDRFATPYPDRFIVFASFGFPHGTLDWEAFKRRVELLGQAKAMGAKGVKIWKNLGLHARDESGERIRIDDQRLEPMWQTIAGMQLPVLIHVADPHANFDPVDRHNERYEWLRHRPDWSYGPEFPRPEALLQQFERVVDRHPEITFILAHMGNRADNLAQAAGLLEHHSNLHMDISARVQELGRQPRLAREFFIRYQDRLLFATDENPEEPVYRTHFRFLETSDEYFDYPFWPAQNFGRWKIFGVNLPDEVLRKVYHDNAAHLLGLPLLADGGRRR